MHLCSTAQVDATATRAGYVNWTPLHLAAVRGYTEILQVLLKAKAVTRCAQGVEASPWIWDPWK